MHDLPVSRRSRFFLKKAIWGRLSGAGLALLPLVAGVTGTAFAQFTCQNVVVSGAATTARIGGSPIQFTATQNGVPVPGGHWDIGNGFAYGGIDQTGLYIPPVAMPSPAASVVYYNLPGYPRTTTVTLLNQIPQIAWFEPATITQMNQVVLIHGNNFLPSATISINGQPYTYSFVNSNLLSVQLALTVPSNHPLVVTITNPNPGTASTRSSILASFPTFTTVTPTLLLGGMNTITMQGNGFSDYSAFVVDGKTVPLTKVSTDTYTVNVFVPPWRNGDLRVTVGPIAGSPISSMKNIPIEKTLITYDVAARFSTQAAFGPRLDVVQHIQHIGLQAFITEQLAQPPVTYTAPGWFSARSQYMRAAAYGNSLLRLRVATALGTFLVNNADNNDYATFIPWETILENAAFGNYRDLLTNMTANARMGTFLNLAGNNVSVDPNVHPNQNYARELMQLFTLGPSLLAEDGTVQLDTSGKPIPTYDQNTLLDLTRALTGWNYAPLVNPDFTEDGVDYSQPLVSQEDLHDQGAKTLFGNVQLAAGQGSVADRTQALDAIFNHPNLPPFVSRILIQHLVKSNPSGAYIQRIADVFKDDGNGVRGNMAAVVSAILLDTEARSGDTVASSSDGFLQDPVMFQLFAISALAQDYPDNQPTFNPGQISQNFWYPPSVNGFYAPSHLIPGTTIVSPEYTLWNNLSLINRSQLLYGMVSGTLNDFGGDYMNYSWLFQDIDNVPDLVTALSHTLYHGKMPDATRTAILNYCATLGTADSRQQFIAAIFLALNSDTFNVTH